MSAADRHREAERRRTRDFGAEIRRRRALLRGEVERGDTQLQRIVAETPTWARGMRLIDALPWVPNLGAIGADRLMKRCSIDPWTEIGKLTVRERLAVNGELDALSRSAAA